MTEWAASLKDFETAAAVAARIGDASHRLSAYLTLIREKQKENKTASLSALQQARVAALSLREPDPRFRALLSVADASLPQR